MTTKTHIGHVERSRNIFIHEKNKRWNVVCLNIKKMLRSSFPCYLSREGVYTITIFKSCISSTHSVAYHQTKAFYTRLRRDDIQA